MKNFLFNLAFVISVIFLIGVGLNLEKESDADPTIETRCGISRSPCAIDTPYVHHEEDESEHYDYVPMIMPFGMF